MAQGRTLFEKIWASHVVRALGEDRAVIFIDRHILQEGTSRQAFDGLRKLGLKVRNPELTIAVVDHALSTQPGRTADSWEPLRHWILSTRENCREFGVALLDVDDARQGIEHVMAPEQGIVLPGCTVVCGDSHAATNGGLGAWAWGVGTTEVRHVLANQTLIQRKPRTMRVTFDGRLGRGVYAKDMILHLIGRFGIAAGTGHAVEYAGSAIRALPIEGRMTICNMSIEFGARSGLAAADEATLDYLHGRPFVPKGAAWDEAVKVWRTMHSDENAVFDAELAIDCDKIAPQISWGTTPQDVIGIDDCIPDPASGDTEERRRAIARALDYIGLEAGQPIEGTPVDVAFIGSCTNSRLSDLEAAAAILRGRHIAPGMRAMVVPGSTQVKRAAEALGLDRVFKDAGYDWRESGCSMCSAINGDVVERGERCISTLNRNFEDRQGQGSRTHLASPAMVAAASVTGRITDLRKLMGGAG